jgi:phosphoglycolate phosphatase-like HAD superfamily hydrolase
MTQQKGSGISPPVLTATALCELAGISRNTLYRYHSDVVQALHETQQKYHPRPVDDRRVASQLRQDNAVLRERLAKLAALADHYFAAWQETRQLLQRRERELADVRRDSRVRVVSIAPEQRSG